MTISFILLIRMSLNVLCRHAVFSLIPCLIIVSCFRKRKIHQLTHLQHTLLLTSFLAMALPVRWYDIFFSIALQLQCRLVISHSTSTYLNWYIYFFSQSSYWNQIQEPSLSTLNVILQDLILDGNGWRGGCLSHHQILDNHRYQCWRKRNWNMRELRILLSK